MEFILLLFILVDVWISDTSGATTLPPNVTASSTSKKPLTTTVPVAVVTIALFVMAILLGIGVSRLMDYIHDRKTLEDDASDISDYTRNILKARFSILAFKARKGGSKRTPEESARWAAALWAKKAAATREKTLEMQNAADQKDNTSRKSSVTSIDLPLPPEDPVVVLPEDSSAEKGHPSQDAVSESDESSNKNKPKSTLTGVQLSPMFLSSPERKALTKVAVTDNPTVKLKVTDIEEAEVPR